MTSVQRTALSVLTTVVIFACFVIAAFTGLFAKIDARFYEPAKVAEIRKQLNEISNSSDRYITNFVSRFATGSGAYLTNSAISSYVSQTPSDEDAQNRTQITGNLFSQTPGLDGIRIIDANGQSVHFSTYTTDVLRQTDTSIIYKDYDELLTKSNQKEFDIEIVKSEDLQASLNDKHKIIYDGKNNRILFSFPFYDTYSAYRGTIIFYVNSQDFDRTLVMQNIITLNNASDLVSNEEGTIGGFVFGMPGVGKDVIEKETVSRWKQNSLGPDKIVTITSNNSDNNSYWVLISNNSGKYVKVAGVYRDTLFVMPPTVQIILLVCVFITVLLVVFMLFSLRKDDMAVIRDRVKRFQLAIINEYFETKENIDWNDVTKKFANRKDDISKEIKQSLGRRAKKHSDETDLLIDKTWQEIVNALNIKQAQTTNNNSIQDTQQIRKMLEDILQSGAIRINTPSQAQSEDTQNYVKQTTEVLEEVEELDEAEPITVAEELEEAETLDDVEEIEEVDALDEEEPLEEAETLDEAEPITEVEELEEAELLTKGEELDEVEVLDDVEEIEEVATLEEDELAKELGKDDTQDEIDTLVEEIQEESEEQEKDTIEDASEEEIFAENTDTEDDIYNENSTISNTEDFDREKNNDAIIRNIENDINDFTVFNTPNFLVLDESVNEAQDTSEKHEDTIEELDSVNYETDAENIEFIDKNAMPFSLTTAFNSLDVNLENLYSATENAIVTDSDGVYSVGKDIEYDDIDKDDKLKDLVDSVIK